MVLPLGLNIIWLFNSVLGTFKTEPLNGRGFDSDIVSGNVVKFPEIVVRGAIKFPEKAIGYRLFEKVTGGCVVVRR